MDLDYASPPRRSWSKLAIASFVHAAVAPLVLPFAEPLMHSDLALCSGQFFWPPIVIFWPPYGAAFLGIAALVSIAKSRGELKGLILATLGLIAVPAWIASFPYFLPSGSTLK
jgi:hypothetical protein